MIGLPPSSGLGILRICRKSASTSSAKRSSMALSARRIGGGAGDVHAEPHEALAGAVAVGDHLAAVELERRGVAQVGGPAVDLALEGERHVVVDPDVVDVPAGPLLVADHDAGQALVVELDRVGRLAHVAEPGEHEVGLDRLQRLRHLEGDRLGVGAIGHHQDLAVGRRVERRLREGRRRERHRIAFLVLLHGLPLVVGRAGVSGAASVVAATEASIRRKRSSCQVRGQYVARPPDRSNTPPVENEQSSEQSQATMAAISCRQAEAAERNLRPHHVDVSLGHLVEDAGLHGRASRS